MSHHSPPGARAQSSTEPSDRAIAAVITCGIAWFLLIAALLTRGESTRHDIAIFGVAIGVIAGVLAEVAGESRARVLRLFSLQLIGVATLIDLLDAEIGEDGVDAAAAFGGAVGGTLLLGLGYAGLRNGQCLSKRFEAFLQQGQSDPCPPSE